MTASSYLPDTRDLIWTDLDPGQSQSLDDLVGAHEDRSWNRQAEVLCGLEIDDEVELCRLRKAQLGWVRSFQDAVDLACRAAEIVRHVGAVGHQAAVIGVFALGIDHGQARRVYECNDLLSMVPEHRPWSDEHRAR